MNYSMFEDGVEQYQWPLEVDALSVYRAFAHLKDGRHKRGVRYPVEAILTLVLLAKLAGMTTPAAMSEWVRHRGEQLKQWLPWKRESFPCASTYSNVLRTLDAEQLNEVLAQLLTQAEAQLRCGDEPSRLSSDERGQAHRHLALDGKTLRGTSGHVAADEQKMHQLGLYEVKAGVLLKEEVTGEKQNELSIISQFLTPQLVKGRILSADALHTQHAFCATVTRWGGDYVLIAKGNQPTLAEDLRLFFAEPPADCRDWRTARSVDKGHGRLELREVVVSTELNEFLGKDWAGVAQVFRLRRTVQEKGVSRVEVVSGMTSLSPTQASAQQLLALVRGHWAIENRLHWRRDVTLGEDHCQVRKGQAPRVLAVLNSFLLGLLDFVGVTNVPRLMRLLDARP